ncbi:hypothetical protein C8R47DRAFT_1101138 [Mycena vitilis]|nr:hypothetical protein C8R47DRAFT_1101138 [Mycena vitilis]
MWGAPAQVKRATFTVLLHLAPVALYPGFESLRTQSCFCNFFHFDSDTVSPKSLHNAHCRRTYTPRIPSRPPSHSQSAHVSISSMALEWQAIIAMHIPTTVLSQPIPSYPHRHPCPRPGNQRIASLLPQILIRLRREHCPHTHI